MIRLQKDTYGRDFNLESDPAIVARGELAPQSRPRTLGDVHGPLTYITARA